MMPKFIVKPSGSNTYVVQYQYNGMQTIHGRSPYNHSGSPCSILALRDRPRTVISPLLVSHNNSPFNLGM